MRRALALGLTLAAALASAEASAVATTASEAPTPPARSARLSMGAQVGFPYVLGVCAIGSLGYQGRPRFDVDATWEPSALLQSYSLAGDWHVLDSPFIVGARLRLAQFQAPWGHGPAPLYFGVGPELGGRFRVGPGARGSVNVTLYAAFIPAQGANLRTLVGLSLGFSWALLEHPL